jgi:cytochrome c-type biogenesis protein CcmH/NrfG
MWGVSAAQAWIDVSRAYTHGGMHQHAKTAVAMARQIHGVDAEVDYAQGMIASECGMVSEAESLYSTALAIDPHHTASLVALASIR